MPCLFAFAGIYSPNSCSALGSVNNREQAVQPWQMLRGDAHEADGHAAPLTTAFGIKQEKKKKSNKDHQTHGQTSPGSYSIWAAELAAWQLTDTWANRFRHGRLYQLPAYVMTGGSTNISTTNTEERLAAGFIQEVFLLINHSTKTNIRRTWQLI